MFTNWSICPITFFIGTAAQDILINHGDMIWDLNFCWFWKKLFRDMKKTALSTMSDNAKKPKEIYLQAWKNKFNIYFTFHKKSI